MEQLFLAGKAYLKINSLVKTPLHEFMAVERYGLWAPVASYEFKWDSEQGWAPGGILPYIRPCLHRVGDPGLVG